MSEISLEDRLRATLDRAAGAPVTAAAPVGRVVAGARRRRRRASAARTALVVAVVLALLGALTVERRNRIGTEPDRIERILENSNTLLPTWLPDGVPFDNATLTGPAEPRLDATVHQFVLSSDDRQRQLVMALGPLDASVWGANGGFFARLPAVEVGGVTFRVFSSGGPGYSAFATAFGTDLLAEVTTGVDLRSVASVVDAIDLTSGRPVLTNIPVGFHLDYDGPKVAAGPRSLLWWSAGADVAEFSIEQGYGFAPFSRSAIDGEEVVDLGWGTGYLAPTGANHWQLTAFDTSGLEHTLNTTGVARADVLRLARSLRPATAASWNRLREGHEDKVTVESGEIIDSPDSSASSAVPASTPGGPPSDNPPPTDVGAIDDVPVGGVALTELTGIRIHRAAVVRLADDRWVGINTGPGLRDECSVTPERDGARLVRWASTCGDHGPYAPDGACLAATCRVGLLTFVVRVEGGRVIADLSQWVLGAPGPALTGEESS